jgi:preprotein translocase subunit Sec63
MDHHQTTLSNADDINDLTTDLYSVLGCVQSSSLAQITAEYRERALKLHPDKNQPGTCLESMQYH